jgi:hypothetical protein
MTTNGDSQRSNVLSEKNVLIIVVLFVGLLCALITIRQINDENQIVFVPTTPNPIEVTNRVFAGTANSSINTIVLTLKNVGTSRVIIGQVKVNGIVKSIATANSTTALKVGDSGSLTILNVGWIKGEPYNIELFDSSGDLVCAYLVESPNS